MHLAIQGSYKSFGLALFKGGDYLDTLTVEHVQASSQFFTYVENFLNKHVIAFEDLDFIAVDQGPGAFTSLRVIITTLNGIAFSKKIPLVGVDGLDALAQEALVDNREKAYIVPLLNAYNNEVYYGVYEVLSQEKLRLCEPKGYKKIDLFLEEFFKTYEERKVLFVGNGALLHNIKSGSSLQVCSAKQVGMIGFDHWQKKINICYEITPLYLKSQTFAIKQ